MEDLLNELLYTHTVQTLKIMLKVYIYSQGKRFTMYYLWMKIDYKNICSAYKITLFFQKKIVKDIWRKYTKQ